MNKDPWKVKEKKQKREERKLHEGEKQKRNFQMRIVKVIKNIL
jgi:hypothetical protein